MMFLLDFSGCEQFEVFNSRYINGLDQTNLGSQTLESCQELCAQDKDCP